MRKGKKAGEVEWGERVEGGKGILSTGALQVAGCVLFSQKR